MISLYLGRGVGETSIMAFPKQLHLTQPLSDVFLMSVTVGLETKTIYILVRQTLKPRAPHYHEIRSNNTLPRGSLVVLSGQSRPDPTVKYGLGTQRTVIS